jgi:hypothetical protein
MRTMALSTTVAAVMALSVPAQLDAQPRMLQFSTETARTAAISGGHDGKIAWLVADYKQLQVRTRGEPAARTVTIELQYRGDLVTIRLVDGKTTVTRGGRRVFVNSPEALESLQSLLGGSLAIFATRSLLSQLESSSSLKAPEMSLLGAAAFVASLVGDVDAPRRLTDRFMEKHRGLFRHVRDDGDTCWDKYTKESTEAWNELQGCMDETSDDGWLMGAVNRLACNAVWVLKSESTWFEYLKCLSPLGTVPK